MTRTRRELLGAGAVLAVGIAGCTGDSGQGNGDGASDSATRVTVESHPEYGDLLADGNGRTLYVFTEDSQGGEESACTGGCADTWPALTAADGVAGGDGVEAELSTFEREDGDRQVTADGWPLYLYSNDEGPGDANGQGVGDVWWVVGTDGTPVTDGSDGTTPTDGTGSPTATGDDSDGGGYDY